MQLLRNIKLKNRLLNLFPVLFLIVINACNKQEDSLPVIQINELGRGYLIYDMAIDRFDNKWFGTSAGLIRYADGTVTRYSKTDGLSSDTIWALTTDTCGNVWCINHNDYISKFDGQAFTKFKMKDPTCILVDKHNKIWVAAYSGLFKYTGNGWQNFPSKGTYSTSWARGMFNSSTVEMYILGTNNNILIFDGNTYKQLDSLFNYHAAWFNYLLEDGTGKTYCAIGSKGLLVVKNGEQNMLSLGKEFTDNLINTIALDKNGRVWLGAESGLYYINGSQAVRIKSIMEDFAPVKEIGVDSYNNVWFVSKNNVFKYTQ